MTRIVLHPGFHKTGTSSIQHFLWHNRAALEQDVSLALLRHMRPLVRAVGRYSRGRDPVELIDLGTLVDEMLESAAPDPDRTLVVSCEGLLGRLPGRPGIEDFDSAPTLALELAKQFAARFPARPLEIVLTTRRGADWLASVYRHHLQGARLTMGAAEFGARYAAVAHLNRHAALIEAAVAPVPVLRLPLERARQHPLGPGGAFCAAIGVPDETIARLTPVGHGNAGPDPALWQQFLDLNRSEAADDEVRAGKDRLAKAAGLGGWTPA